MKAKIVCFKFSKTVKICILIILLQIGFIVYQIKELREVQSFNQIQESVSKIKEKKIIEQQNINMLEKQTIDEGINTIENQSSNTIDKSIKTIQNQITIDETQKTDNNTNTINQETSLKEYETMPRKKKGFKIIGKITIPKLELDTYILEETTTKALKVSVTKLYGPGINQVGNFCIAGHNYRNNKMFGGIKKLENKDKIILTDTYGRSVTYEVYENYQTSPKDVSSLSQETEGDRELTLITCTAGAIKRVIVKAVEVYD